MLFLLFIVELFLFGLLSFSFLTAYQNFGTVLTLIYKEIFQTSLKTFLLISEHLGLLLANLPEVKIARLYFISWLVFCQIFDKITPFSGSFTGETAFSVIPLHFGIFVGILVIFSSQNSL